MVALRVTKYVLTGNCIVGEGVLRRRGKRGDMGGRKWRKFYRRQSYNITGSLHVVTFLNLRIFFTWGVEVCDFAFMGGFGERVTLWESLLSIPLD